MRRDTLVALGAVCLIFWAGIYFLFSLKPPQPVPASQSELVDRTQTLNENFNNVQQQLNKQLRSYNLLLDKLRLLKTELVSKKDAVVNIDNLINLIENPDNSVENIVRIVDRNKPKERKPDTDDFQILGNSDEDEIVKEENGVVNKVLDDNDDDIDVNRKDIEIVNNRAVIPVLLFSCNRVTVTRALDLLISYRPDKQQFPIIVTQDCNHEETRNVIQSYGDEIIYIQQPDQSDPVLPEKEKKI